MESSDKSQPKTLPFPTGGRTRKKDKLRVYNRSRESFLSLELALFDTTAEPLKRLFDYLVTDSNTSLWLKPYRGIPVTQGARFFDLIYLDEACRVIWELDSYPNPRFTVLEEEPASALLMPPHTVFASQVHLGDQLEICDATELEGILANLSNPTENDSGTQEVNIAEPLTSNSGSFPMPNRPEHDGANAREAETKGSLVARLKRWFSADPQSENRSTRRPRPSLKAYHWTGGRPQSYPIGNISGTGFYLLTNERPYPGTLIMMTLQKTDGTGERPEESIAVNAKVIRWGADGVGFAFVCPEVKEVRQSVHKSGELADQESLQRFLRTARE